MCFNFEVSISTFIFSWLIGLYLLTKRLKIEYKNDVIFLLLFSSIQLIDAIFWYNEMKPNMLNYVLTSFILPLLLSLQVLFNMFVINKTTNIFIILFIIIFILKIFISFYGRYTIKSCNYFSSPLWTSNELDRYLMFVFALLISYGRYNISGLFIFSVLILLFLLNIGAIGSMWCAISNILALYYFFKY